MNKFCFGTIYNGRLWEKELGVSALEACWMKNDPKCLCTAFQLIVANSKKKKKKTSKTTKRTVNLVF